MPFAIPMIWREPRDHHSDCYFCCVKTSGFSAKTKHKMAYLNLDSAIRPVSHDNSMPVPQPPPDGLDSVPDEDDEGWLEDAVGGDSEMCDVDFVADDSEPETFTQEELNDLVRDLNLP